MVSLCEMFLFPLQCSRDLTLELLSVVLLVTYVVKQGLTLEQKIIIIVTDLTVAVNLAGYCVVSNLFGNISVQIREVCNFEVERSSLVV